MWGATTEGRSWIWGEVGVQVQSSAQPLPPSLRELSFLEGWASWPEKDVPKLPWLQPGVLCSVVQATGILCMSAVCKDTATG